MKKNHKDPQTYAIIGAAMEVHKELGPGFLESVYHEALKFEFACKNIPYEHEKMLNIYYKNNPIDKYFICDFLCYENIIVELKAVDKLTPIDEAQIINYLKISGSNRGLLFNFAEVSLKYKRFILSDSTDVNN